MGLPQLEQWAKTLNGDQSRYLKVLTKDALLCLEAFLLFLANDPSLLSSVMTFIQGLKALIDLQISAIELVILQLDIENQIINAILQPYKAFQAQLAGALAQLPFAQFDRCPPIKLIEDKISNGFNNYVSPYPPMSQMKSVAQWIKRKEFELARRKSIARKLAAEVEKLKAVEGMIDALVAAIKAQFASLLAANP